MRRTSVFDTYSQSAFDVFVDDAVKNYFAVSAAPDYFVVAKQFELVRYRSLIEPQNITQIAYAKFHTAQRAQYLEPCAVGKDIKIIGRIAQHSVGR